jgi:N-acetylneuraminic acid mutarotase
MSTERTGHAATVYNNTVIVCGGYHFYPINLHLDILGWCESFSPVTSTWTNVTTMPMGLVYTAMTTINNTYLYVFGGIYKVDLHNTCSNTAHVYMYDGVKWVNKADMPKALQAHTAVKLDESRVLICGGAGLDNGGQCVQNLKECYIYSTKDDTWTNAPSLGEGRSQHAMVMFQGL